MMLAAALLLGMAHPVAGSWEAVASDGAGRILLDSASLRRSGSRVRFRLLFVPDRPAPGGIADELFEAAIDCRRRTLTLGRGLLRGEPSQGAKGEWTFVDSEVRPPPDARPAAIAPGSPQEGVMRRVCA